MQKYSGKVKVIKGRLLLRKNGCKQADKINIKRDMGRVMKEIRKRLDHLWTEPER